MNFWRLIRRGLAYYRKTHFRIILGTMISTAILVGAFVIGDSVRYSLRKIVDDRLGSAEFALSSGDRFFQARIADELSERLGTSVAPLLQARGIAIAEGGRQRVNQVQVVGVDARFGEIGGAGGLFGQISRDEAVVNLRLASRTGIQAGDEILLRILKLDVMPKDAPLSLDSESTIARRFRVKAIAGDSGFGRFNLRADQVAPETVFLSLSSLAEDMEIGRRANILLVSKRAEQPLDILEVEEAARSVWTLADAGLEVREIPGRRVAELKSSRVFLDPPLLDAALKAGLEPRPILTYFVNDIRSKDKGTPYSFISAPGPPIVPPDMRDDEIIINEWLAADLNARTGDALHLDYYVLGPRRDLQESTSEFRIRAVVPLAGIYADGDLLPDFPGLAGEENCRDWKPGIPIDLDRIRNKDEDYWDEYRGTPKAYVTLSAAQRMWTNRFGNLTAIRFEGRDKEELEKRLGAALDPAELGVTFREVKKEGLLASSQSVNFSQLFLGLSFFIIAAALMLTSLLFVFNAENRARENGLFLALGFPRKTVKRLVLGEGACLVAAGGLAGGFAGILYNQIILGALKTVWRGTVGTSALHLHLKPSSILAGVGIGIAVAFLTIWISVRRQVRRSIAGLQRGRGEAEKVWKTKPRASLLVGVASIFGIGLVLALADFGRGENAFMFFFAAGSLVLIGGMALMNLVLINLGKAKDVVRPGLFRIGIRNGARKRSRSITLIGLLACGLFIVFTVGANRQNAIRDAEKRGSGTGGFALYGESSMPVLYDLDSPKGKEFYGLQRPALKDVSFVEFRVREGDDASCLNLNRVAEPQLVGVDPAELAGRGSFTFAETTEDVDPENPWAALDLELPDGSVPAVADRTVIVWGLGKAVGDTLTYQDEKGESFRLKLVGGLANSVFQGNIIIAENTLIRKFPSISGYRLFLVDAPFENLDGVAEGLSWIMQDQGMDLVPASARLAEFNTVQNTYLAIFLILGGFGLLLGSAGLGIVVSRNIRERRSELALLRAVGFPRKSVLSIVLAEHLTQLAAGIFFGTLSAFLATIPSIKAPGSVIPYPTVLAILVIVCLNGGIWTYATASLEMREDLLPALRRE